MPDTPPDPNQILIATNSQQFAYNFTIKWDDGQTDENVKDNIIHTYDIAGTYTVEITGKFPQTVFGSGFNSNSRKLLSIEQWGDINWKSIKMPLVDALIS